MDYSSQDSNPIDFSKNNKDLIHNHLGHVMSEEDLLDRRPNTIVVSLKMLFFFLLIVSSLRLICDANNIVF